MDQDDIKQNSKDLTGQIMAGADKRFDKIEAKIDVIVDTLGHIDSTLAGQHESLKDHMRRTAVAEEGIAMLRKEMKPMQRDIDKFKGALRLGGICLAIIAALAAVVQALR